VPHWFDPGSVSTPTGSTEAVARPGSHRTWRADFPHQRSSAVASHHCKRLQLPVGEAQFRRQQRHNLPPAHASIGCLLPPSPANLTGTPVAQNATITESHDCGSSRFTALPNFSIVRSPRPYLPHHVGGEDRGETAGLAHPASPAARRRPDKYSSRCSGFLQFMALGTTTFVRLRSRSMVSRASSRRPMCA
jgi:hypothetical protein